LWRAAAELNPQLPGVFTGLGRAHLLHLEFDAATEAFQKQEETQPDPEAKWYLAALTAPTDVAAANEYLLAIPPDASAGLLARRDYLLATLVPFTPESPPVEVARATGIALVQAELWPLAVHALTEANHLSDSQPAVEQAEIKAFLGHALAQAGRPALDLFEQARRLDPDSALPLYFYGVYLRRQGALKAAETLLMQALALDPENAAIYVELAQTKIEQGDFAAAEEQYAAAIDVAEAEQQIEMLRVRFYAGRGYRVEEAGIPAAEELVEADDTNAEAHDLLGWMYYLAGQPAQAEKALQRALELEPNLVSARYHLARQLESNGNHARATEQYQRVVDWDTSGVYRERAFEGLQRLASN
jgi:tetratricopeptide (TPR) repeat protein